MLHRLLQEYRIPCNICNTRRGPSVTFGPLSGESTSKQITKINATSSYGPCSTVVNFLASTAFNIIIDLGLGRGGSPSGISAENAPHRRLQPPTSERHERRTSPLIIVHIDNLLMPTRKNNYRQPARGVFRTRAVPLVLESWAAMAVVAPSPFYFGCCHCHQPASTTLSKRELRAPKNISLQLTVDGQ